MALIGDMIHSSYAGNPSIVNYCMFVALFAMLSLFYLIPATIKDSLQVHPILPLIVDLLNTHILVLRSRRDGCSVGCTQLQQYRK